MINIKRLTELAGLNEYTPTTEFVQLDQAASDAMSEYQSKNNDNPLEKVVQYHAMKNGVDYDELLQVVDKYLKNPEMLMPGGVVNNMGEDHNEVADPHGGAMISPPETTMNDNMLYDAIETAKEDAEKFDVSVYSTYPEDYEGQLEDIVNEITKNPWNREVQEFDEWNLTNMIQLLEPIIGPKLKAHMGMTEESNDMNNNEINRIRELSGMSSINEYPDAEHDLIRFSVDGERAHEVIMARFGQEIEHDGDEMLIPENLWGKIQEVALENGGEAIEMGSEDDYDGQPSEYEEWQDYMGGDDWDQGQYDEDADLGRMYEEYQEQLAFKDFEQAMQEAVRFAGGTPPEEREKAERGRLAQRFAPGAADIAGQVTDQPTEPHPKTVISDKEPWEYTGDLGSSLGLKQKIDPENYASVLTRDFSKWVKGSELKSDKTRTVYDKMNNKQIKSTVWHPKGRHEDIVAFEILAGSGGNFAPGVYVRRDSVSPEIIQRGRESGR